MTTKVTYTCDKCKKEVHGFEYSFRALEMNLDFCTECLQSLKIAFSNWLQGK